MVFFNPRYNLHLNLTGEAESTIWFFAMASQWQIAISAQYFWVDSSSGKAQTPSSAQETLPDLRTILFQPIGVIEPNRRFG